MSLKIDVFNHIFPKPFFERLQQVMVNRGPVKRWLNIPFLHDIDVRFRMLEEFGPDYHQILSLSAPPIETINPDRNVPIDLASLANDTMADLVHDHPDRFPGFKMFWADTAVFGSKAATKCGLEFYGVDQVVFATDAPFDPEGGPMYIRETIKVIDGLDISSEERDKIYRRNAERLFNRAF